MASQRDIEQADLRIEQPGPPGAPRRRAAGAGPDLGGAGRRAGAGAWRWPASSPPRTPWRPTPATSSASRRRRPLVRCRRRSPRWCRSPSGAGAAAWRSSWRPTTAARWSCSRRRSAALARPRVGRRRARVGQAPPRHRPGRRRGAAAMGITLLIGELTGAAWADVAARLSRRLAGGPDDMTIAEPAPADHGGRHPHRLPHLPALRGELRARDHAAADGRRRRGGRAHPRRPRRRVQPAATSARRARRSSSSTRTPTGCAARS